jgi:hypothetical protein
MAFSGLSTYDQFTATGGSLIAEDISPLVTLLAPSETPILDWLGDSPYSATSPLHEYVDELLRPNYITASTAINSATAATGFQTNGLAATLTVGTLLENETDTTNATYEVLQVTSIPGPNSLLVSRAYGGTANGSLAVGGQLFVRAPLALEGQDASGDVTRPRIRRQVYTKIFQVPITVSLSQAASRGAGGIEDEYNHQKALRVKELLRDLEKEVVRGVASGNSIGSETLFRSFNGLRATLTAVNSTITASSFDANPHLYIGNLWKSAFDNGLRSNETIALIAGPTFYRSISNLNDTKVYDSNTSELFKRRITQYTGPLGTAEVILSPWMPAGSVMGVVKERVRVVPLRGRTFAHFPLAMTGSAIKGMLEGEYTLEISHQNAMFQGHT